MIGSRKVRWLGFPVLLEVLHGAVDFDEGGFDRRNNVRRKDRFGIHRSGYRPLPCLKHLLHLSSYGLIDPSVGFHESAV